MKRQIDIIKKSHKLAPPPAEPEPVVISQSTPKPKESAHMAVRVIGVLSLVIVLLLAGIYYFYTIP